MFRFRGFSAHANDAVNLAISQASLLGHTYIGSEHLLLGLLLEGGGSAAAALNQKGITPEALLELIIKTVGQGIQSKLSLSDMTPRCRRCLEHSFLECSKENGAMVGTEHLLMSLLKERDSYAVRFLLQLGADPIVLYRELQESMDFSGSTDTDRPAPPKKEAARNILLQKYGRDLTKMAAEHHLDPIIGRDQEIERVIRILSRRTKNNPCLIGEAGVGKTAIAEGLALRISQGRVPRALQQKRLIALDLVSLIAGTKYRGEFEERVKNLMDEVAQAHDIILFIDEIHNIIGAGAAEGSIDAANILKPQLSRGEIQLMGATTIAEYRRHIERDSALARRFQSVLVEEPTEQQTIQILRGILPRYEQHHHVHITDEALEAAVRLSRRYLTERYLPDKAIDLIDEAASKVRLQAFTAPPDLQQLENELKHLNEEKAAAINSQDFESAAKIRDKEKEINEQLEKEKQNWQSQHKQSNGSVTAEDIADIVSSWTGVPVKQLNEQEGERLLNMEKVLHERVVGQEEAVSAVSKAIRRGRIGLKDPKRPIGSFLFLGPTGVGKTELCKALAEALFGDENAMIRLDMSEYMEKHSVSRMVGSPPGYVGYDDGGQLTEKIRRKPYSVILFDEVEKAHPDVFNMLLQILEDGILTDSQGRKVSFKNSVIIMTSNIGARMISERKNLGFVSAEDAVKDDKEIKSDVMGELKQHFKPEFLNRIDDIIVFHKLTNDDIKQIAKNMLNSLTKRVSNLNLEIRFTDACVDHIAKVGYDPVYGARPLRRAITSNIEDKLSEKFLEGAFKSGDTVEVDCVDGEFTFQAIQSSLAE